MFTVVFSEALLRTPSGILMQELPAQKLRCQFEQITSVLGVGKVG